MRTPCRSRRRADSCAADEPPNTAPDGRGLAPPITTPSPPVDLIFASSAVLSTFGLVKSFVVPPSAVLSAFARSSVRRSSRRSSSFTFSLAFQLAAAAPDEGRTQR